METGARECTQQAFTLRRVDAMRPAIERLVEELIEALARQRAPDVIADVLGVPREHVDDLKRWSDDLAQFVLSARLQPEKYATASRCASRTCATSGSDAVSKWRIPAS